ncbi:MAG: HAD family phosphatase [Chlamydiae bacterium]|nr:HAD family phosphatase [Chlamydiota bacterium]
MVKGCICLDIDGTLTADPYRVPPRVIGLLAELYRRGWVFLFVTGRLYSFALSTLKDLPFPYFFAVQNGADLLRMPEGALLSRAYISSKILPHLEELCDRTDEDFLLYSGFEKGDFCYYRPSRFSSKMLEHLELVKTLSHKPWQEREHFLFPEEEQFSLIKVLGSMEKMYGLQEVLRTYPTWEVTCVKDPLAKDIYLNLITSPDAHKGHILKKLRTMLPSGCLLIAAGDDLNDAPMLEEADFAIVMKTAPASLWEKADLMAEPAAQEGIIEALLLATQEKI